VTDRLDAVWAELDAQVAAGRLPGWAAALRCGGSTEVRAGGRLLLDDARPVEPDTPFRLASVSKPVAGVLTLALAEDGVLALDDDVARWLPELAEPRVLAAPDATLDDTVPAERPVTVRHLLTNTAGFGIAVPFDAVATAMGERGIGPGPAGPDLEPDEFLRRLAELPLGAQPGTTWRYHTGTDVLSVLLARAAGRPLSRLLAERVTGPLGLPTLAFSGDPARLPGLYLPTDGGLQLFDPPDGWAARPPRFESLAAGLVGPAGEVLQVFAAVADGGAGVVSARSAAALATDQLTPEQRASAGPFLAGGASWGHQTGVDVDGPHPGSWGWDGGTGTSVRVDPARDLVGVLLTQRMMEGAEDGPQAFWDAVYACL
jgi:CubicO group peptidase (beta-lactamase class C family)